MPAVFFQLNKDQDADMKRLMKEMGYTKKSEFFRFLLNYYRFEKVTEDLKKILTAMVEKNMIDSRPLSDQMKDLDDEDELENPYVPNHLQSALQKNSKAIKQKKSFAHKNRRNYTA